MAKWKKGDPSPNPKGRPQKEINLTKALKEELRKNPHQKTAIIQKLIRMAMGGDYRALQLIFNRIDGVMTEATPTTAPTGVQLFFVPVAQLPPGQNPLALPEGNVIEGQAKIIEETTKPA